MSKMATYIIAAAVILLWKTKKSYEKYSTDEMEYNFGINGRRDIPVDPRTRPPGSKHVDPYVRLPWEK